MAISSGGLDSANALDPRSFDQLKRLTRDESPEAIRAAARQFEALFINMVLKSMREATPKDGMFDSEQSRMYLSLLDQQLAIQLSNSGGVGFADVIARQLGAGPAETGSALAGRSAGAPSFDAVSAFAAQQAANAAAALRRAHRELPQAAVAAASDEPAANVPPGAREFVNQVWPHALEASRRTGIPAHFMVAQAALETGWGRAELRHADGRPSYNLFNIKAGRAWQGETVGVEALEYRDGQPVREAARFRAYQSYAEAFDDYARLMAESPRYAAVLGQQEAAGFARGLQQAGYATDPMYADKLERIIGGNTLRLSLAAD